MKTNINGYEVEGTPEEIKELIGKRKRKKCKTRYKKRKPYHTYIKTIRKIALKHLRTKESLGGLISKAFNREAGGSDYVNVRKAIKKIKKYKKAH